MHGYLERAGMMLAAVLLAPLGSLLVLVNKPALFARKTSYAIDRDLFNHERHRQKRIGKDEVNKLK